MLVTHRLIFLALNKSLQNHIFSRSETMKYHRGYYLFYLSYICITRNSYPIIRQHFDNPLHDIRLLSTTHIIL